MKSYIFNLIDEFINKYSDSTTIEKTALWTKFSKDKIYGIPTKKLKARFNKKYIQEFSSLDSYQLWDVINTLMESEYFEKQIIASIILKEYKNLFDTDNIIEKIYNWTNADIISSWIIADQLALNILSSFILEDNSKADKFIKWIDNDNILLKRMAIVIYAEIELNDYLIDCLFNTVLKLINIHSESIEKASSWALRNVYNYNENKFFNFIEKYGHILPRKTLRNAIYSLDEIVRLTFLYDTKQKNNVLYHTFKFKNKS